MGDEAQFENHFLTILVPNISEELAKKIVNAAKDAADGVQVAAYYESSRENN